jgi:hypothetical protein
MQELTARTECIVILDVLCLVKALWVMPYNILKCLAVDNNVVVCGVTLP